MNKPLSHLLVPILKLLARTRLPETSGQVVLTGLNHQVETFFDQWGVPHIYARDIHDAAFTQGYIHASERLFQMDFNRRLVAGRLSEILGEVSVPLDRWMRTLGMRRSAVDGVNHLLPETLSLLEAYSAGINAFIVKGRLPLEFTLLRYQPEPWQPVDCAAWTKMMALTLSVNWETELLRAHLVERLGAEKAAQLEPPYFERYPYIVPPGVDYSVICDHALRRQDFYRRYTGPNAGYGVGSNNWVIAGSRTASGKPLLANDMHLAMTIPSIWFENHLCAPNFQVTGVSFPGIPGVIAGHNGRVAWGFTNGFPDVQDLYIEHLHRRDDGGVQYEFKGKWMDARVVNETIYIKGGQSVTEEVIITCHGPIINNLAPDLAGELPLAMRWTALEPDRMLDGISAMNRARNCTEFREALRNWAVPVQNTVYADIDGNIGYSFPGKVPIRHQGDGRLPVPGWTGEFEWDGYIPFEELPHLYNPSKGYVVSANNRVVDDDYPYFITRDHVMGDRAQRITEMIEQFSKIDPAIVQTMQFDQICPSAREIGQYLHTLTCDNAELSKILELFGDWDGHLSANSPQAAIYETFVPHMIRAVLSNKLGDLTERYLGRGPTPVLAENSIFGDRALEWLQKTLSEPHSHWFDQGHGETRDDMMRIALRQTIDLLKEKMGANPQDWAWGKFHHMRFAHSLGRVSPLDLLFNRGPYPLGGDYNTVWATGASYFNLEYDEIVGPPFRFIADLSDLNHCFGLLAPGQSGNPASRHYDDQIDAWFNKGYHPMYFNREDVQKNAKSKLVLKSG